MEHDVRLRLVRLIPQLAAAADVVLGVLLLLLYGIHPGLDRQQIRHCPNCQNPVKLRGSRLDDPFLRYHCHLVPVSLLSV